jgi:hypothetical protein
MDFTPFIGRNAFNVQTDLNEIYPAYQIHLITPTTIVTADYRENRIRITHDNNYTVLNIVIG